MSTTEERTQRQRSRLELLLLIGIRNRRQHTSAWTDPFQTICPSSHFLSWPAVSLCATLSQSCFSHFQLPLGYASPSVCPSVICAACTICLDFLKCLNTCRKQFKPRKTVSFNHHFSVTYKGSF